MDINPEQRRLRLRILEISHESRVSHLGSALSVVDIIAAIYNVKKPDERFVLSAGHSGVALYAVLEQHGLLQNPSLQTLNVHPDRNPALGIDVSSGSLGQGLPIALGIALSDRSRNVWAVSTDGEMAEGSIWEALRIASEQKAVNLRLFINANGFGAYGAIDNGHLAQRIQAFGWQVEMLDGHNPIQLNRVVGVTRQPRDIPTAVIAKTTSDQFPFLKGLDAHYYVMTEADFLFARKALSRDRDLQSPIDLPQPAASA
jgi:transketolase